MENVPIDVEFVEASRECFLQLSLQGGAVYMDFDKFESYEGKTLAMVRMSFDGYGCCTTKGNPMTKADATVLKRLKEVQGAIPEADAAVVSVIIQRYILANRNHLWEDALIEHGLV